MKKWLNWFRLARLENDLDRELSYHVERRVQDLVDAGASAAEARRQATLELGGLTQVREEVRDVWLTRWLRDFFYDLRFSARTFRRNPAFTTTVVLSLALGIGAATAIYSLVDQVVLHALPVRDPQRLVLVDWNGDQVASGFGSWNLMSYPICRDLQQQGRFFEGVFCRAEARINLSVGGEQVPAAAEIVSGSYFAVLGVGPALGRVLGEEDDRAPGSSPVVVLSYDFWKTQLGGSADVLGRKLLINQHPMTVVGVAAPEFRGIDVGAVPSLWIPASMSAAAIPRFEEQLDRRKRWMQVLARLQPGVSLIEARTGLQPWFKAMLQEDLRRAGFPAITAERRQRFLASTLELTPAPQGHSSLRRRMAQPLWVLFAATGVLLALACLNVAGLFLARGAARGREIVTRLALGASRGRIGRQLIADSVLLAVAGGALGVAAAPLAVRALIAFLPGDVAPNALQSTVDSRMLAFALLASVAAGLMSGVVPAIRAGRGVLSVLSQRGAGFSGGVRLRKAIVTLQIAFSLILVIAAALFVRTLTGLLARGPGFETTRLISFTLDPVRNGYNPMETSRLIRRVYEELQAPGIAESTGVTRFALLTGGSWNDPFTIQTNERTTTDHDINVNAISPGFLATLGVRVVAGRDFDAHDSRPPGQSGRRSALVNEAFVQHYLRGRNPLGVRIGEGSGPDAVADVEVVGVVTNFSYRGMREKAEMVLFPMFEGDDGGGTFYLRVRQTPEAAYSSIRAAVRKADPALPILSFRTVDEQVARSLTNERLLAALSTAFGGLALLLSLVGLYGVMSFVASQRTPEIGIRLALGATRSDALWLVLRDALLMIGAGAVIALPVVEALGRLVESLLFGVTPADPATIAMATLAMVLAAVCASYIPARRAAMANPVDALRFD
ncbi:MAG: ABC transporter permease [Acidobacteria bacterium]|nr:ABC transporter permease [Acidobacteriota bacterium]